MNRNGSQNLPLRQWWGPEVLLFFSFFLLADVAVVVAGGEGEVERRKSALCASIAEHLKPLRGKESERGREKEREG